MVLLCFFRCLLGCRRLFLFLCVKRLDFRCFVAGTAVVALQFPGFSDKVERASASRALIVGDLCWHLIPSFPVPGGFIYQNLPYPVNPNGSRPLWGGSHGIPFFLTGPSGNRENTPSSAEWLCYWNFMLLRMISGIVPGTQSRSVRPNGKEPAVVDLRNILDQS